MLTYKNDHSFSKAIISTASIALQEQLIKDINNVSKMLGIDIKVGIAKGINNYSCLRKIDEQLKSPHMNMDSEEYKTLNKEKKYAIYRQNGGRS
jgi:ATP-dependent DNA helicase DinG